MLESHGYQVSRDGPLTNSIIPRGRNPCNDLLVLILIWLSDANMKCAKVLIDCDDEYSERNETVESPKKRNFLLWMVLCATILFCTFRLWELQTRARSLKELEDEVEALLKKKQSPGKEAPQYRNRSETVVLTSMYGSKQDPQENRGFVAVNFKYAKTFYDTVEALKMETRICADPKAMQALVRPDGKQHPDFIQIIESWLPVEYSTNDYRFFCYLAYLKSGLGLHFKYILMVDISDVFFLENPFNYMRARPERGLFLSPDAWLLGTNMWVVHRMMRCFGISASEAQKMRNPVKNAGAWGGKREHVMPILECMTRNLRERNKGRGNCNMATYNWCIYKDEQGTPDSELIDPENAFINPFRKECNKWKPMIHNKCGQHSKGCPLISNSGDKVISLLSKPCSAV